MCVYDSAQKALLRSHSHSNLSSAVKLRFSKTKTDKGESRELVSTFVIISCQLDFFKGSRQRQYFHKLRNQDSPFADSQIRFSWRSQLAEDVKNEGQTRIKICHNHNLIC